jgi:predicted DNA-binding protein (UPF0251 family)
MKIGLGRIKTEKLGLLVIDPFWCACIASPELENNFFPRSLRIFKSLRSGKRLMPKWKGNPIFAAIVVQPKPASQYKSSPFARPCAFLQWGTKGNDEAISARPPPPWQKRVKEENFVGQDPVLFKGFKLNIYKSYLTIFGASFRYEIYFNCTGEVSILPRPRKCRWVSRQPLTPLYRPQGVPLCDLKGMVLPVEGLEALRLADAEGLDQGIAAEMMGISPPTFCRVLAEARAIVARALVNGWAIRIEGGDYRLRPERDAYSADSGALAEKRGGGEMGGAGDVVGPSLLSQEA